MSLCLPSLAGCSSAEVVGSKSGRLFDPTNGSGWRCLNHLVARRRDTILYLSISQRLAGDPSHKICSRALEMIQGLPQDLQALCLDGG